MGRERLGGLDLLRGVAALAVVFLHVHVAYPQIATPFTKAYLAVDFFFMLSGFVLTRTYHQRFVAGLGPGRFMVLRLKRLWPTVAVGAVLGLISQLHVYSPQQLTLFFAMNLALMPYLAGGVVFPLNGVIWSIFFELVANLFHASLLAGLARRELLVIAIVMAGIMIFAAIKLGTFGGGESWDAGSWQGNFVAGLPRVMLSYAIGCLLYLKLGDRPRRGVPPWLAPGLLVAALLGGRQLAGWHFDLLFVVVVCPIVIIAGLSSFRWMSPLERGAGDLSFPLYAVHMPILMLAAQAGVPWFLAPMLALAGAALTLRITRPGSRPRVDEREAKLAARPAA